jgi:hypothetical protein
MPRVVARAVAVGALMLPLLLPLAVVVTDRPLISGDAPFVLHESRRLEWGGRDFTTKQEFRSFLRSRGADYETWVKRHPNIGGLQSGVRARDVFVAWCIGALLVYLLSFGGGRRSRESNGKSNGKSPLRVQTSPSLLARRRPHGRPGAALPARRDPVVSPVTASRAPPPDAAAARAKRATRIRIGGLLRTSPSTEHAPSPEPRNAAAAGDSRWAAKAVAASRGIAAFASGVREKCDDFGLTRSNIVVSALALSAAIVAGWVVFVWTAQW